MKLRAEPSQVCAGSFGCSPDFFSRSSKPLLSLWVRAKFFLFFGAFMVVFNRKIWTSEHCQSVLQRASLKLSWCAAAEAFFFPFFCLLSFFF